MAWFSKFLKNRQFVIALGFLFLVVLIWAFKILAGGSSVIALIATVLLLAAWVALLFIEQARAKHDTSQLAQSLKTHADDQLLGIQPERREELERLQQEFTAAIDKIKSSELGKGMQGNKALYALPWYMVIGPFGSGKTTAIKNSGLEFPLGIDKEVKGVGGTRNCDWWFTDSAILLDTSGRYTSEEEDRDKWLAFLDLLKKHRRKEPINGVVVGISLLDLMKASPADLEWHAQNVRKRIDEVIDRLNIICPIYVVFTKCDLLNGFVDFFQDLNPGQRHQVLGCSLTRAQQQDTQPRLLFEQEFQALTNALLDYRLERLAKLSEREQTSLIYVFPLEFARIKENLTEFIDKLFQKNKLRKTLFLRGFYFTSGTQMGAPEDFVMQEIANTFNLVPEQRRSASAEIETKSYFIKNLFTDVIFPDRHLVTRTSRFAANERRLRLAVHACMAVFLLLFILGLWNAYGNSSERLANLRQAAKGLANVQWDDLARRPNYFQALEIYRQQIALLETHAASARLWSFWMDRSRRVLPAAYDLYLKKMEPFIKERAYNVIETRLQQALARRGALTDESSDTVYDQLHAYLLFNQCRDELADTTKRNFLSRQLSEVLRLNREEDNFKNLARAQTSYFARGWAYVNSRSDNGLADAVQFIPNEGLVDSVRRGPLTAKEPNAENFYRGIKRRACEKFPPLSIGSLLPQSGPSLLNNSPEAALDGIFTVGAWKTYMKDFIRDKQWDTGPDCVMGDTKQFFVDQVKDKDAMARQIEKLYFRDYARSWRRFLGSVDYPDFGGMAQSIRSLELLGDAANSPLKRLLERAKQETRFENVVQRKTQFFGGDSIDQQFADLHWLLDDQGGQVALNEMIGQFKAMSTALRGIKDNTKIAKNYAADLLNKPGEGDLPNALTKINNNFLLMPSPNSETRDTLRTLFERPLQLAWEAILTQAQEYLNQKWQEQVYNQNPFNGDSSPQKIIGFFKPNDGVFWKFFDNELAPFVESDSWQPNRWKNRGLTVSEQTQKALMAAARFRDGLASGGEKGVTITIEIASLEKPRGHGDIDWVVFEIGGKAYKHKYGDRTSVPGELSWPGPNPKLGASIKLINGPWTGRGRDKVVAEIVKNGEYGWRNLLREAYRRAGVYFWNLPKLPQKNQIISIGFNISFAGPPNMFSENVSFQCPPKID